MVKKNLDSSPPTEQVDHRKDLFDQIPLDKQLHRLLDSQLNAVKAVQNELFSLASATEEIVRRLRNSSGRLVYAGSGCSIRIGVQDGIELVPKSRMSNPETMTIILAFHLSDFHDLKHFYMFVRI